MPRALTDRIEIEYETFGDPGDPGMLLVSGLGAQLTSWDPDLCAMLAERGLYVIRFDNRDVGRSTKVPAPDLDVMAAVMAAMSGEPVEVPYRLADMALDAWGLLDHLGIDRAHLVGASMGGMIVQTMAIQHPDRVRSLTSIMSTTGDPDVGHPDPELLAFLLEPTPTDREGYIEASTAASRAFGSPAWFDEERTRARHALSFDRGHHPPAAGHHLLAVLASPSRSEGLRSLDVPALVIHGAADRLVHPSGGERTAECIRGSELLVLEGMGHDLPAQLWPRIVDAIAALAAQAEGGA